MSKMAEIKHDAPLKILIEDLTFFEKTDSGWIYKISEIKYVISKIHIQGKIVKTAGFSNEILIIDDGTRKSKITVGPQTPGDLSWVNVGTYCSVIGTLLENGKLPLIGANKIACVVNQVLQQMWPLEVKELKNVMANKFFPRYTKTSDPVNSYPFITTN